MQVFAIFAALLIAAIGSGAAVLNNNKMAPTPSIAVISPTISISRKPEISASIESTQSANLTNTLVTKVTDGDTIEVNIKDVIEKVRLIGVDTPETVDPRKPVQCFGKEASNKTTELLLGKKVQLEEDTTQGDRDKYGRLLRYVLLEDGTNVNKLLIQDGYAYEYTYNLPYKYQSEFKKAQVYASDKKQGLWADNVCVTPSPTTKPTNAPTPTIKIWPTNTPYPTAKPTIQIYIQPTEAPVVPAVNANSGYSCDCGKSCPNMSSCDEAYFQLNQCGCSARDGDHDGVPCEDICR